MLALGAAAVLSMGMGGCEKKAAPTVAAPTVAAPAVAAPGTPLSLFARLESEARGRSAAGLRAELVLDTLDQNGVRIVKRQQYVGAVVGAAYCLGGNTASGLALSVCEYADEVAARQGRELSMDRFRAVSKEVLVNQRTTLTLSFTGATPASPDEKKRIVALFSKL